MPLTKKYHVGCSGYYYPAWKNKFYPQGLAPKNWLAHYSSVFDTVELNGTFYRTPTLASLQKYAEVTPPAFKFSVKMSKYISHILKFKESRQSILDFQDLVTSGLGNKLSCFLFQLPPSFHYTDQNLELILENIPHTSSNVVELRHTSWWNENTQHAFKKAGITFCNVDFPGMDTYFMHTSDLFYLRLHGNPELFKSSYSRQSLEKFCGDFPKNSKQYCIYFNNTFYEAGYTNALQLLEIIKNTKAGG